MTSGYHSHFDGSATTGVLGGIADNVLLCDPNDTEQLTRIFEQHRDIAAAILEPTGRQFRPHADPAGIHQHAARR